MKNPDNNKKLVEIDEKNIYSFTVYDKYIITSSNDLSISVHSLDLDYFSSKLLCSSQTQQVVCEVLVSCIRVTVPCRCHEHFI